MPTPDPEPTPPYPLSLPPELADQPYADLPTLWQRRVYRAARQERPQPNPTP